MFHQSEFLRYKISTKSLLKSIISIEEFTSKTVSKLPCLTQYSHLSVILIQSHGLLLYVHTKYVSLLTLSSKRKYTDATNNPWNEYRKWEVIDHTAKLCHDPLNGLGQTKCSTFVIPNKGNRKNKDFNDFLKLCKVITFYRVTQIKIWNLFWP